MPSRYQDLTGSEHQIEHAYEVSGRAAGSHGFGTPDRRGTPGGDFMISRVQNTDRTCLLPVGVRTALHDLTDSEHKIVHAYNVSGRLGTTDRTCLIGIRRGLQDLRGLKHQINI